MQYLVRSPDPLALVVARCRTRRVARSPPVWPHCGQLRRRIKDLRISVECLSNTHVGNAHVEREQLQLIESSITKFSQTLKWCLLILEGLEKDKETQGKTRYCSFTIRI